MKNWKAHIESIKSFLYLLAFAFVVYLFVVVLPNRRDRALKGRKTVAEISKITLRNVFYTYTVNDTVYESSYKISNSEYRSAFEIGEKFKLVYESSSPGNGIIFFNEPVIDSVNFGFTLANSIELVSADKIRFHYQVEEKMFKRIQKITGEDIKMDNPDSSYVVAYSLNNPEIAYVFFTL